MNENITKPTRRNKPELNGHTTSKHGGARAGAGRKPKALMYAPEIARAEAQILDALPDVIESLIFQAQNGDVAAAKYLIDRVFGRITEQCAAIADDTALPYEESDLESAQAEKQWRTAFNASDPFRQLTGN